MPAVLWQLDGGAHHGPQWQIVELLYKPSASRQLLGRNQVAYLRGAPGCGRTGSFELRDELDRHIQVANTTERAPGLFYGTGGTLEVGLWIADRENRQ